MNSEINNDSLRGSDINMRYLSYDDERRLILASKNGDMDAFNTLYLHFENMIKRHTDKYCFDNYEDALSEAKYSFVCAVKTFDLDNFECRLGTYASKIISTGLKNYCSKCRPESQIYSISASTQYTINKLNNYIRVSRISNWSEENLNKAANDLNISVDRIKSYLFVIESASASLSNSIDDEKFNEVLAVESFEDELIDNIDPSLADIFTDIYLNDFNTIQRVLFVNLSKYLSGSLSCDELYESCGGSSRYYREKNKLGVVLRQSLHIRGYDEYSMPR